MGMVSLPLDGGTPFASAGVNVDVRHPSNSQSFCRSHLSAQQFRGGNLKVSGGQFRITTWNVEGLTQSKIMELQWHMQQQAIDIICLQETHREDSDVQITDAGFLLILSGQAETEVAETAGVGFCYRHMFAATWWDFNNLQLVWLVSNSEFPEANWCFATFMHLTAAKILP